MRPGDPLVSHRKISQLKETQPTFDAVGKPIPEFKAKPEPPKERYLDHREMDVLGVIACHHFLSHQEYAKNLANKIKHMSKTTFTRIAGKLKQLEVIDEVEINLHTQGGQIKILFPTKSGYELLNKLKVAYVPIPGNGSMEHRFWQHRIWTKLHKKGDLGGIEYSLPGTTKRVDVGIVRGTLSTAYEVVMGPNLEKEESNALLDASAGWTEIIFAVESEDVMDRLRHRLSSQIASYNERIRIRLLREFA